MGDFRARTGSRVFPGGADGTQNPHLRDPARRGLQQPGARGRLVGRGLHLARRRHHRAGSGAGLHRLGERSGERGGDLVGVGGKRGRRRRRGRPLHGTATPGTYHVVATSAADASRSSTATVFVDTFTLIPGERLTLWNPGIPGGVPSRTVQCGPTVSAAAYGNGSADATAGIQASVDACPEGQVVQLSAGTFKVTSAIESTRASCSAAPGPPRRSCSCLRWARARA